MRNYILLGLIIHLWLLRLLCSAAEFDTPDERTASYWMKQAQQQLAERLARTRHLTDNRVAKNIVFLLGDGLSITTVTAARILKGQRMGHSGEESRLAVENFTYAGLSKTYCTDSQTADSACTATAYMSGVKTNMGAIGQSASGEHVEPITLWAQRAGKATGIVTTTRLTHASPAGAYAHVPRRSQELDIARQLLEQEPGRQFHVILGGGLGKFASERSDGRNLIQQWHDAHPGGCFVRSLSELQACRVGNGSVLGVFNDNHMAYHLAAPKDQPRLCDMTKAAIEHLSAASPNGYYVFIEGGRIDHGHHETRAGYALDETLEFDAAVETAARLTDEQDTLIVATSDHSHTLSLAGYAKRGTSILGQDDSNRDTNGVPYSILNYAVGKWQSLNKAGKRENPGPHLRETSFTPSYIRGKTGVHAGEDVAVFAQGPQAHLFSGIMEQNLLPHLMSYAACLGDGTTVCQKQRREQLSLNATAENPNKTSKLVPAGA
ncbi:alkaline phosphatase, tissue-nonspecific isozyme [Scaptodrosophila lebanonensis]|uniref:alkaline phosphatase n=1 Tax=Drosophila lebanonensis TaxID=7225 RepID=A0A6J2TSI7_DROLE|nr:alkaline phosphatase, tissue-nonspecific isozyme [Scaptodrosophila lebanonensis]